MNTYNLTLLTSCFVILPFFLAFIHSKFKQTSQYELLNYRYFVFFNVVLSGLSVSLRTLLTQLFHPAYDMVATAMLAMVTFTLLTLWRKNALMLAPALLWSIFVLFGAIFHLLEIHFARNTVPHINMLWLHIAYDLLVCIVLAIFIRRLRHKA